MKVKIYFNTEMLAPVVSQLCCQLPTFEKKNVLSPGHTHTNNNYTNQTHINNKNTSHFSLLLVLNIYKCMKTRNKDLYSIADDTEVIFSFTSGIGIKL